MTKKQKKGVLVGALFLLIFLIPFIYTSYFYDPYIFSKWILVYGASGTFFLYFAKRKSICVPVLTRETQWCLGAFSTLYVIDFFFHKSVFLSSVTLDRACFFILILSFFSIFKNKELKIEFFLDVIFISTAFFLFFMVENFLNYKGINDLSLSFGNINISAEFLGFSLVLQLSSFSYFTKNKIHTESGEAPTLQEVSFPTKLLSLETRLKLLKVLIPISFFVVYASSCRSVYLSLFICFFFLLFFSHISKKDTIVLLWAPVFVILLLEALPFLDEHFLGSKILFFNKLPLDQLSQMGLQSKSFSTHARFELLLATLELIKDHPFGVGAGEFTLSFVPYIKNTFPYFDEETLAYTPHNEYLRVVAEDGILFFFSLCAFVFFLIWGRRYRFQAILKNDPHIAFIIFFLVEAFFQFPLINGGSFLLCTLMFGYFLSELYQEERCVTWIGAKSFLGYALFGVFSILVLCVLASNILLQNFPVWEKGVRLACRLNNHNWHACIYSALASKAQGDFIQARKKLEEELIKRPYNFVALRELAFLRMFQDKTSSCRMLKKYDQYFDHKSSMHPLIIENCLGDRGLDPPPA